MKFIYDIMAFFYKLQITLFTMRKGELVGQDPFGNKYYQEKNPRDPKRQRRWVMYHGEVEASKVPPEWFGWLHHMFAEPIPFKARIVKPWVREHLPNLTGTVYAYRPPGHPYQGGVRSKATGDYEAWTPKG